MKKVFFMSLTLLILFTGCSSEQNELITAIDKSYDLDTGSIVSNFNYTTEYNNIDIAGTVDGQIEILYGDDYDKVTANINFGEKNDAIEYYVDKKENIINEDSKSDVVYAPLYLEGPELDGYIEQIPEPTTTELEIAGQSQTVNQYSFELASLETEVAEAMFDPIVKLGFVSPDVLKSETIDGTFNLNYYVDPETGYLLKENLSYTSQADNTISTKTTISIENTYDYEQTIVELPAGYGDASSEATSSVASESDVA